MNVYIAYGWPEGKWHGEQLRQALIIAGYQITDSVWEADVIIAHSAGCYLLPADVKAKLILMIGLPNWPSKPLIKCTFDKVSMERKDRQWLMKTFWHIIYALSEPTRFYQVFRTNKRKFLPNYSSKQIILIHNHQDTYMYEASSRELSEQRGWQFRNFSGQHDDLWQNPSPYIHLIDSFVS